MKTIRLICLACGLTLAIASAAAADEVPKLPDAEMPTAEQLQQAIDRGVQFLLDHQNANGSWGSATRTKDLNIYAPVPGAHDAFRGAVTALSVSALIETGGDRTDVQQAIERGEQWLLENLPDLRRADPVAIYNVWGHAYGIRALVRMHHRRDDIAWREKCKDQIRQQIELLSRYESVDGGWGYYDLRAGAKRPTTDATSFITATVLVAFDEARDIGIEIPSAVVDRAIRSLHRQRKPDFSYLYGEYLKTAPVAGINRPGGSLGRSQACNVALRLWDDPQINDQIISDWLHRMIARNGWLDIARKRPIPHESHFAVAGYFFYYGHFYAGHCIQVLPESEREPFQAHLAGILLRLQEKDGSWWDFPLYNYHQPYGTAYALMTLHRCRQP